VVDGGTQATRGEDQKRHVNGDGLEVGGGSQECVAGYREKGKKKVKQRKEERIISIQLPTENGHKRILRLQQ